LWWTDGRMDRHDGRIYCASIALQGKNQGFLCTNTHMYVCMYVCVCLSVCPSIYILFVGGPNTRKTNQDGGRPPSWKIENRPYLQNGSTDLREIWHDNAYWTSERDRKLKCSTFENPRWRTAAILKKFFPHILSTDGSFYIYNRLLTEILLASVRWLCG